MKVWYLDVMSGKRLKSYDGHNGDVAGLSLKPEDTVRQLDNTCCVF
jgi:hypothetical protein